MDRRLRLRRRDRVLVEELGQLGEVETFGRVVGAHRARLDEVGQNPVVVLVHVLDGRFQVGAEGFDVGLELLPVQDLHATLGGDLHHIRRGAGYHPVVGVDEGQPAPALVLGHALERVAQLGVRVGRVDQG